MPAVTSAASTVSWKERERRWREEVRLKKHLIRGLTLTPIQHLERFAALLGILIDAETKMSSQELIQRITDLL